jgi:hypothetical protein
LTLFKVWVFFFKNGKSSKVINEIFLNRNDYLIHET